ncbi:MAG: hypothetical protein U0X76_11915 [Bacteroidia bacterium]
MFYLLLLFIVADTLYSFAQHYTSNLDGDLAESIVPSPMIKEVYGDPFGIEILKTKTPHSNPNRYFSHAMMSVWFRSVPHFLQKFTTPINSVFAACAIFKIIVQLLILFLLVKYVTQKGASASETLIAMALVVPMFQIHGYKQYMGIVDDSTSYVFFYALPLALLALYYLPVYRTEDFSKPILKNPVWKAFYLLLAIPVCFSGPLNPGVILVINLLLGIRILSIKGKFKDKISASQFFFLFYISLLACYSLYIGSFNSMNNLSVGLMERFSKLPAGIGFLISGKLGWPVLLSATVFNVFYIKRNLLSAEGAMKWLDRSKWILLFAIIYILLLPFGGYREYRPNVIRYDTIMPVTLMVIFLFAGTSLYILSQPIISIGKYYLVPLAACLILTLADAPKFNTNIKQREAITAITTSTDSVVYLKEDYLLLSWQKIKDAEDSKINVELLRIWNIEAKPYVND